jgi:hypothetical protein
VGRYFAKYQAVVINVVSITSLGKSLILIKEEKGRNAVFSLSLLERILLCDRSVGSWLVPLLTSKSRSVQERAVEYLLLISSISTHKRPFLSVGTSRTLHGAAMVSVHFDCHNCRLVVVCQHYHARLLRVWSLRRMRTWWVFRLAPMNSSLASPAS